MRIKIISFKRALQRKRLVSSHSFHHHLILAAFHEPTAFWVCLCGSQHDVRQKLVINIHVSRAADITGACGVEHSAKLFTPLSKFFCVLAPWTSLQCSTVCRKMITLRIRRSTVINSNTLASQMVLTTQVNETPGCLQNTHTHTHTHPCHRSTEANAFGLVLCSCVKTLFPCMCCRSWSHIRYSWSNLTCTQLGFPAFVFFSFFPPSSCSFSSTGIVCKSLLCRGIISRSGDKFWSKVSPRRKARVRGILLQGGGAVPRCSQREAVLCCCRNVFAVRHFFWVGGVSGWLSA